MLDNDFSQQYNIKPYDNQSDLIKSCDIGLSTVCIKKKILVDNLFPSLKTQEDYVAWLKITKKN